MKNFKDKKNEDDSLESNFNKGNNSDKKSVSFFVISIFLLIAGVGYALWTIPKTKGEPNIISTGCFKTIFTEGSSNIDLINAYPISDEQGSLTNAYNFTIENTCSLAASYQVNIESLDSTTLSPSRIKISIDNEEPVLLSSLDNSYSTIPDALTSKVLKSGKLTAGTSKSYSLRLWLDNTNGSDTISNEVFNGKIVVTTVTNKN